MNKLLVLFLFVSTFLCASVRAQVVRHVATIDELEIVDGCVLSGFQYGGDDTDTLSLVLPENLDICTIENVDNGDAVIKEVVILSPSVRKIADGAWGESDLESIVLNEGLETIGRAAFLNSKLKSVKFPSTLKRIGDNAFSRIDLGAISLPPECSNIGTLSFSNSKVSSIEWPTVELHNFRGFIHNDIKELHVPSNVKSLGDYAFSHNPIEKLTFSEGIDSIGNFAFASCLDICLIKNDSRFSSVKFPSSLKYIGERAFDASPKLKEIDFGEGVECIAWRAFADLPLLTEVSFPSSLKTLRNEAFKDCTSLHKVTFNEGIGTIKMLVFENCQLSGEIVLPGSLRKIDSYAFANVDFRYDVHFTLSEGITEIEPHAFCHDLNNLNPVSVSLPSTLRLIGEKAFLYTSLQAMQLPQVNENGEKMIWDAYYDGSVYAEDVKSIGGAPDFGNSVDARCSYVARVISDPSKPTSLRDVKSSGEPRFAIYSLSGSIVSTDASQSAPLPSGIYIKRNLLTGESELFVRK